VGNECWLTVVKSYELILLPAKAEQGYLSQYSVWLRDWTTGRSRFDPRQGQRIFPLASLSRLWGPPNLLYNGCRGSFPGVKPGRGVTQTTHLHLVPRSWKSRSYIPPSSSVACSGTALIFFPAKVKEIEVGGWKPGGSECHLFTTLNVKTLGFNVCSSIF
jgi:hypothetical protein